MIKMTMHVLYDKNLHAFKLSTAYQSALPKYCKNISAMICCNAISELLHYIIAIVLQSHQLRGPAEVYRSVLLTIS